MTAYTQTCTETVSLVEILVNIPDIDTMQRWADLLNSAWSTTTGGKKPRIVKIIDERSVDTANQDWVLVYPSGQSKKAQSVGYDSREVRNSQSIDCRTAISHARIQQIKREVDRIMMANRKSRSATGFQVIDGPTEHDLSDKMRMMYRYVLDYTGVIYAEPIGG